MFWYVWLFSIVHGLSVGFGEIRYCFSILVVSWWNWLLPITLHSWFQGEMDCCTFASYLLFPLVSGLLVLQYFALD